MPRNVISACCVTFVILIIVCIGELEATQPFWSMDPSTKVIERADSLTGFDITKYDIQLAIDDQTHYINGSITAIVLAEDNLNGIDYELTGGSLAVTQVLVNDIPVTNYTHQDGVIHIPLNFTAGTQFTTKVVYSGIPGNSPAPYNIGLRFTTNGCTLCPIPMLANIGGPVMTIPGTKPWWTGTSQCVAIGWLRQMGREPG